MVKCTNCRHFYIITDKEEIRPTWYYCRAFDEGIDYKTAIDDTLGCEGYEQELDDNQTKESST